MCTWIHRTRLFDFDDVFSTPLHNRTSAFIVQVIFSFQRQLLFTFIGIINDVIKLMIFLVILGMFRLHFVDVGKYIENVQSTIIGQS